MIPLGVRGQPSRNLGEAVVGRVTFVPVQRAERRDHVIVVPALSDPNAFDEYAGVLVNAPSTPEILSHLRAPAVHGVSTDHLHGGDVVSFDSRGYVRTLYRRGSPHNFIFATDRCNSLCLMCSQPPKKVDDSWRVREHLRLIELVDPETRELGITGGEPTLLEDGLLNIVTACKERLPKTALHILSNGRLFRYGSFARALAEIEHPNLMIGIPLYSDLDCEHDFVVQAKGAFYETMIGVQNLGQYGVPVEIRCVIHRLTIQRLTQLAEFIYRNITFASHVALMGLELTGFAISNLEELWTDPWEYRNRLAEATLFLASRGMNVSIFNHQLCTVPETIWPYCRRAISDWKNEYLPECSQCGARERCGGFFTSGVRRRYSVHISPVVVSKTPFSIKPA